MKTILSILLLTLYLTGCCCLESSGGPVYLSPNGKVYPTAWGKPPDIQTTDHRPLPYEYGSGSSTLYYWILKQQWDFGEKGKRGYK